MPGAVFMRNLRLARAYAEGAAQGAAANPHPAGSPAAQAWAAGAQKDCDVYAGGAECTDTPAAPVEAIGVTAVAPGGGGTGGTGGTGTGGGTTTGTGGGTAAPAGGGPPPAGTGTP